MPANAGGKIGVEAGADRADIGPAAISDDTIVAALAEKGRTIVGYIFRVGGGRVAVKNGGRHWPAIILMSGLKATLRLDMIATRIALAAVFALSPAIADAVYHDGQGVSQYRNGPFGEFDLTVIGIVLVVVMVILGIRALKRRRL